MDKSLIEALEYIDNYKISSLKFNLIEDNSHSLSIKRKNDVVDIRYREKSSIFYALNKINANIDNDTFEAVFDRKIEKTTLMMDYSRNGVHTLSRIKELIRVLALFGYNGLMLYTEETYEIPGYPKFGYLRGAYTKEELKQINDYGQEYGIEVIPCIQTLGHLSKFIRWPEAHHLRDGWSTLLCGDEEVYKLIDTMIQTCRECFTSKSIHLGMDESFEMGLNRYFQIHGYQDRNITFLTHVKRVNDIAKKYGFKAMIWSDMIYRLNQKDNYKAESIISDSVKKLIPDDLDLVYWDYYRERKEDYDSCIKSHLLVSKEVIFAGGSWRWAGFSSRNKNSMRRTDNALQSAIDNKISHVICTSWGDDGNECSIFSTLPAVAQYGIYSYEGSCSDKLIDDSLRSVGETLEMQLALDVLEDRNGLHETHQNEHKQLLLQDPLLGIFDFIVKDNTGEEFLNSYNIINQYIGKSKHFNHVYESSLALCDCLQFKSMLGHNLRKAYKANNKDELKRIIDVDLAKALYKLGDFTEALRDSWMHEYKPFGFEILDGRLGWVTNRLISAQIVIQQYLDGVIDTIPELEYPLQKYNNNSDYKGCYHWKEIVSGCEIYHGY